MDQLRAMLALLSSGTRKRLVLAVIGSAFVGLAEVVGLLMILPLMQLLTGSTADEGAVKVMADIFNTTDTDTLAIISAALVFAAFLTKGLLTVLFRWWMLGFLYREEAETSLMLLRYYVRAPYQLHLQRNSADLIRTMNDAVGAVFSFVIVGGIGALGEAATIICVLATLLVLMPLPTVGVALYFGLTGFFFARAMRRRAVRYGQAMIDGSLAIYQGAMQTLGGVKEIKIRHKADHFLAVYRKARWDYAGARRAAAFINDLPKYFMEILFIVGIALTAVVIFTNNASDEALTMLTLFVAAGFRVLPSTVRLLGATNGIRVGVRSLELIVADMEAASALAHETDEEERDAEPLVVRRRGGGARPQVPLPGQRRGRHPRHRPRPPGRHLDRARRRQRRRQEHARRPRPRAAHPALRQHLRRRKRHPHPHGVVAAQHRPGAAGRLPARRHPARQHRVRRGPRRGGRRSGSGRR